MKTKVSTTGYLDNSPDRFNPTNLIPDNRITMEGVTGKDVLMFPIGPNKVGSPILGKTGENYYFPDYSAVLEMAIPKGAAMKYEKFAKGGPINLSIPTIIEVLQSGSIKGYPLTDSQRQKFAQKAGTNLFGEYEEEEEELEEDYSKKGGPTKGLRKGRYTNKNIKSSINEALYRRNETLYGPGGRQYYKPFATGGWLDSYQPGGEAETPEAWEREIRDIESKIGNPSQWNWDNYNQLQNKLNDYKRWRETTPKGKAVKDYHNEPNEYTVPVSNSPQLLMPKGWLSRFDVGGGNESPSAPPPSQKSKAQEYRESIAKNVIPYLESVGYKTPHVPGKTITDLGQEMNCIHGVCQIVEKSGAKKFGQEYFGNMMFDDNMKKEGFYQADPISEGFEVGDYLRFSRTKQNAKTIGRFDGSVTPLNKNEYVPQHTSLIIGKRKDEDGNNWYTIANNHGEETVDVDEFPESDLIEWSQKGKATASLPMDKMFVSRFDPDKLEEQEREKEEDLKILKGDNPYAKLYEKKKPAIKLTGYKAADQSGQSFITPYLRQDDIKLYDYYNKNYEKIGKSSNLPPEVLDQLFLKQLGIKEKESSSGPRSLAKSLVPEGAVSIARKLADSLGINAEDNWIEDYWSRNANNVKNKYRSKEHFIEEIYKDRKLDKEAREYLKYNSPSSKGAFQQKELSKRGRFHKTGFDNLENQFLSSINLAIDNYHLLEKKYPDLEPQELVELTTLMHNSPSKALTREYVDFYLKNNEIDYVKDVNSEIPVYEVQGKPKEQTALSKLAEEKATKSGLVLPMKKSSSKNTVTDQERKNILEFAKKLPSKKQGGWLDKYQKAGIAPRVVTYTDKDLYDKAHKAEMDSLYVRKTNDQTFTPGLKTRPLTQQEKEYWKDEKTGLAPYLAEYDPRYRNTAYFGHFKKPVIHNVYEPIKEKPEYMEMRQVSMPEPTKQELDITAKIKVPQGFVKQRFNPETRLYEPVYVESWNTPASMGRRIYNKNIPSSTAAPPAGFEPQFEPDTEAAKMSTGGWLDNYQKKGEVKAKVKMPDGTVREVTPKEYAELYKSGNLTREFNREGQPTSYVATTLPEVDITDVKPRGFADQLTERLAEASGGKDWYKDPSQGFGKALYDVAMIPFTTPQLSTVYGLTDKVQTPSEAMNIENPYGAFAVDAILDPANLIGAEITKLPQAIRAGLKSGVKNIAKKPFTKLKEIPNTSSSNLPGSETSNLQKMDPEKQKDLMGFLRRRQFIKDLQKEGLIGEKLSVKDLNRAALSTAKTETLTKKALDEFGTTYRRVKGELPAGGKGKQSYTGYSYDMSKKAWWRPRSEFENMDLAGVDRNDPFSIAEYQATHVPMQDYGYRATGQSSSPYYDFLFQAQAPDPFAEYGPFEFRFAPKHDYTQGSYEDWYKQYYKNKPYYEETLKNWLKENPGKTRFDFLPKEAIQWKKTNRALIGKRGEKILEADKSYPFYGKSYSNMTPQEKDSYLEYAKKLFENYNTGWPGEYKKGGQPNWLNKYQ
jgi:hypothetical protein